MSLEWVTVFFAGGGSCLDVDENTVFWKYSKIKLDQITYACTAHVVVHISEPRGTMKRGRGGWCVWQFPIACFEEVPLTKGPLGGGEVAELLCT